jgi:protein TonB
MASAPEKKRWRSAAVVVSLVVHSVVFAFVLWLGTRIKLVHVPSELDNAVAMLEQAGGPHAVRLVLPKLADAGQVPKIAPEDNRTKTMTPSPAKLKKAMGGELVTAHDGNGTGTAAACNGADAENVTPSFPVYSPRPAVTDRTLLPETEQKIVVDVDVNELGAVLREELVKGLGNRLDQIVLDTVKTWRFQPATKDGKPVPTEAELIFPLGPGTPISVGWRRFADQDIANS